MKIFLSFLGIAAVIIVAAISGGVGKYIGKELFSNSKPTPHQIEQKLIEGFEEAAKQVNRNTPTMVDDDTRMDKATVGPGARVTYHYTFPKYSSQDIDSTWLIGNLRPVVKNNVCNSKEMKLSIQYGGVYAFSYSGSDGVWIASFEVDCDDCGFEKTIP